MLPILGAVGAVGSLLQAFGGSSEVPGLGTLNSFEADRTRMGDLMASDIGKAKINAQALMDLRARNLMDTSARTAAQGASNLMGALGSGAEGVVGGQQALANYNQTMGMTDQWKLAADMNRQSAELEQWNAQQQNALKTAVWDSKQQLLPTRLGLEQANQAETTAGGIGKALSALSGGLGAFANLNPAAKSAGMSDLQAVAGLLKMPTKAVFQSGGKLSGLWF